MCNGDAITSMSVWRVVIHEKSEEAGEPYTCRPRTRDECGKF